MKRHRILKSAFFNIHFAVSSFPCPIVLIGLVLFLYSGAPIAAQSQERQSRDGELLKNLKTRAKNDIEREVFAPGEKKEKDGFQSRAGQGGADPGEQLKRELDATAEKEDDNPLSNIARTMFQVRQRMTQTDAGPATRNLQKQIVSDLDRLIEQARQSSGQCSPSASNSRQSSTQDPKSSPSRPGVSAAKKSGAKPAMGSSPRPPGGQPRKSDMQEIRTMINDLWGELPPNVREQMLQNPVEEFVPKYQQLIEDYYRDLSNEKKGNGD